jgi:hypothetical protein
MNLGDILSAAQIIPDLTAKDRWAAIEEMIALLVSAGKVRA